MVPRGGIEPPTRGFSDDVVAWKTHENQRGIKHRKTTVHILYIAADAQEGAAIEEQAARVSSIVVFLGWSSTRRFRSRPSTTTGRQAWALPS